VLAKLGALPPWHTFLELDSICNAIDCRMVRHPSPRDGLVVSIPEIVTH